jgi:hypothetical protein
MAGHAVLLETVAVGRKTPLDGKLEIGASTADALRALGDAVPLRIMLGIAPPREGIGAVIAMPCTCAKGAASGRHEHHFVESDLFHDLEAGTRVSLMLEGDRTLRVTDPGRSP